MSESDSGAVAAFTIDRNGLGQLVGVLKERGFQVVAPTIRDGCIVYDQIDTIDDLPAGWTDEQRPGHYRLKPRNDRALFGYNVGPHSWKKFLFPASLRLWRSRMTKDGIESIEDNDPVPAYAFLGVRACELEAIRIQDRVLTGGAHVDPTYQQQRQRAFIVAVNCTQAGETCFCTSMNSGPEVTHGYDLSLTELPDAPGERFLVQVGTEKGAEVTQAIHGVPVSEADRLAADRGVQRATHQMGRSMDTSGIQELLQRNLEHPRWDETAERCLACANCTLVCPTCFCSDIEDTSDLSGEIAERWRYWGSCFTADYSYIHGGSVRSSISSRYRQWLTHKVSTWFDQFGTSGCVGCGRCITWCPVGIDLTEEVAQIRQRDGERRGHPRSRPDRADQEMTDDNSGAPKSQGREQDP